MLGRDKRNGVNSVSELLVGLLFICAVNRKIRNR